MSLAEIKRCLGIAFIVTIEDYLVGTVPQQNKECESFTRRWGTYNVCEMSH
jgi:hypothetical protein